MIALRPVTTLLVLILSVAALAQQGELRQLGGFDVIVVGSEPEAIAAAVAAAEAGARTMLVSEDSRVGGLFVLGQLNVLDLRTQPVNLQQGLFERWWQLVGRGHSFDLIRAEQAFHTLLSESKVELRLGVDGIAPVVERGRVVAVAIEGIAYPSSQVIDGTADMDFAARAGAGYSVGFSSLGLAERMVDTLVFRIDGVDWPKLRRGIRQRGPSYASVDDHVAWGHFDGYPARYTAQEPGIRLRGLNLGLQDDGSVLVNALLIHGIDPFDSASRSEGRARAEREAARVVDYLAAELPGFERASYAGAAPRLYIRESRHLEGQCTLTVDDMLDHRVTPFDVAAGGYPLDVQILTPFDSGFVFGAPDIYGVRLCVSVPQEPDGLWVVGKSAGYDPIAASSARVVPFGMNLAEAVGLAAALAASEGVLPAELVADQEAVTAVREQLEARGAYLPTVATRTPAGPYQHPHYRAYRLMLSRGLAVGGYDNDPGLDSQVSALSYLYLLSNVLNRFFEQPQEARELVQEAGAPEGLLTVARAAELTHSAGCRIATCPAIDLGNTVQGLPGDPAATLTRGAGYALAAALVQWAREEAPRAQGNSEPGTD